MTKSIIRPTADVHVDETPKYK